MLVSGIPHHERSGLAVLRPTHRPSRMAFARKDEGMLKDSDVRPAAPSASCLFHKGDQVDLAKGSYQGAAGAFLNLRSGWRSLCHQTLKRDRKSTRLNSSHLGIS